MAKMQLTIYVNQSDMSGDIPLHELIVRRLLHFKIAGATVMRGLMGYGMHHKVHRKRLFGMSDDHPIAIIAVDDEDRIRPLLPELRRMVPEGLITLHAVEVV